MTAEQLKQLVLDSFAAERSSDTQKGLSLIHPEFKITEMNADEDGKPFVTATGQDLRNQLATAFGITTRNYQFVHVLADEATQTVIIEFVESYLDEATGTYFRTPTVSVCEIKDGLVYRTRHYGDKRLSLLHLDQTTIDEAFS